MRDVFCHADTEGNYDTLINSLKEFFETDENGLDTKISEFVISGGMFIFGGDYSDAKKNGQEEKLLEYLVKLHQQYPNAVKFIIGNRDANKLRFAVENPQYVLEDEIAVLESKKSDSKALAAFGDERRNLGKKVLSRKLVWTDNANSIWFIQFLADYFKINLNTIAVKNEFDRLSADAKQALYYQWTLTNTMGAGTTWKSMLGNANATDRPLEQQARLYTKMLDNVYYILAHGQFNFEGLNFSAQHGAIGPKFANSKAKSQASQLNDFPEADATTKLFHANMARVVNGEIKALKQKTREEKSTEAEQQKIDIYDRFQDFALGTANLSYDTIGSK